MDGWNTDATRQGQLDTTNLNKLDFLKIEILNATTISSTLIYSIFYM